MRQGWWWVLGLSCAVACGGRSLDSEEPDAASTNTTGGTSNGQAGASSAGHAAHSNGSGTAGAPIASSANGGYASASDASGGADDGSAGDGGEAGTSSCVPGSVRCRAVREHCDMALNWVKESFVCATDITGASEVSMACAVKSDGRMTCFGDASEYFSAPLIERAPNRQWAKLILADDPSDPTDHELCGIDVSGAGVCWSRGGEPRELSGKIKQVASGTSGLCVIAEGGAGQCLQNQGLAGPIAGTFQDLVIRNNLIFGLDPSGKVTAPSPQFELPAGVYTQISASSHALCGLRADHSLACAPNALPAALAAQRFSQVAVEYWGSMCAIRDDQTIMCDTLQSGSNFTPPAGKFTRIVALSQGMCGIGIDGTISCFGNQAATPPGDW